MGKVCDPPQRPPTDVYTQLKQMRRWLPGDFLSQASESLETPPNGTEGSNPWKPAQVHWEHSIPGTKEEIMRQEWTCSAQSAFAQTQNIVNPQ